MKNSIENMLPNKIEEGHEIPLATPATPEETQYTENGGLRPTFSQQTRNTVLYDFEALELSDGENERPKDYKGRYKTWPGIFLLVVILGCAAALITYFAIDSYNSSQHRARLQLKKIQNDRKIKDGGSGDGIDDIVDEDGQVGNPKKYPPSKCELPNYVSKNGKMYVEGSDGSSTAVAIKGVNWFGMETSHGVPFGLWDNLQNGTTAYEITSFLSRNRFNSVRIPLSVHNILKNVKPDAKMVNKRTNRAISMLNYMDTLKSIIKALGYRQITVMISMHTLTPTESGELWYNDEISEDDFLDAIDILTKNLCDDAYYNVLGIDLKNEPAKGTWGGGGKTDFQAGAQRIGNRMLKGCKNWLAFVEGVNAMHKITIDGESFNYFDWWGAGLQAAGKKPVKLSIKNKLVWAPHYYTPAVFPQVYLYSGGKKGPKNSLVGYKELDDELLMTRIKGTFDDMFGYLAGKTGPAVVLGEFAGLYAFDKHPKKTTQRCTDMTIKLLNRTGFAGGYMWSLNPESGYEYNPADTYGQFQEGLLTMDWLNVNKVFLAAMEPLSTLPDVRRFPCIKKKATKTKKL